MKLARKIVFWVHLVVGLGVGLGVAMLAGTGALLAFEKPIVRWVEQPSKAGPRLEAGEVKPERWTVENLVTVAGVLAPEATPSAVTVMSDADAPVIVAMGREKVMYLNAYTGEKVGEEAAGVRSFFRTVLGVHRWLAMSGDWRNVGRQTMAAVTLGFLGLAVSGLWLWMPRKWKWGSVRAVVAVNPKLKGKTRDWNWHNVVGFWTMVPLVVMTVTGLIMSYPWANRVYFAAFGQTAPAAREGGRGPGGGDRGGRAERPAGERVPLNVAGLNAVYANAVAALPGWTSMTLQLGGGRRGGGGGRGEGRGEGAGARGGSEAIGATSQGSAGADANARGSERTEERGDVGRDRGEGSRRAEFAQRGGREGGEEQVGGGREGTALTGRGGRGAGAMLGGEVVVEVSEGDSANPLNRTTLTFNRRTGELVSSRRFADQALERKLRPLVLPVHRGEVAGNFGRGVALVACLGALVLVYTGFALSWRRLGRPVVERWRGRRKAGSEGGIEAVTPTAVGV